MKIKLLFIVIVFFISFGKINGEPLRTDSIRNALLYHKSNYPKSQYRDIYKDFMQDYFGPGHILKDTVAAGNYLRHELEYSEKFDGPDYESTGFEGNFYRVNIRLIKDGIIPYDTFFEAFVKSVQAIIPPEGETWRNIWQEIDNEIKSMDWTFDNETQERADLADQFSKGNFIVHHSRAFNESNNFHYRIISREYFNKVILPTLKSSHFSH